MQSPEHPEVTGSSDSDSLALKRTVEALREITHIFDLFMEYSPIYVFFKDEEGKPLRLSKNYEAMLGRPVSECLGKTMFELFPPELAKPMAEDDQRIMREGIPIDKEETLHDRVYRTVKFPIIEHGKAKYLAGFTIDITDLKVAEAEKRKLDAQILQAQKLESLGVLAAGIAHDFNNLLAGIYGNIDMAAFHCPDGSPAKTFLTKACADFNRAKELTQKLLTFSKGGAPALKTTSLSRLLQETPLIGAGQPLVKFDVTIADDLWMCDIDEGQFAQAINHIVVNALQAIPGEGRITITAHNIHIGSSPDRDGKNKQFIRISIADTGNGISEEVLPRIFDPFFSTRAQGAGLGLSAALSIIQKHGGNLTVESTPGKGSIFHIFIPAAKPPPAPETEKGAAAAKPVRGPLLIMDDEKSLREILCRFLERLGYTTVPTANGTQAKEALLEYQRLGKHFEAAILDLTISGGPGGKEILPELRKIDPSIKFIATSGYCEDPVMANPSEFGFSGKIEKPFLVHDLVELLNGITVVPQGRQGC